MQKYSFPLVLATAFLDILGFGIIIPVLPFLISDYGAGPEWVGYAMAIYSLGMFLGGLVFGKLSDRFGRRPMLMFTTFFNFLGFLFLVFAPSFWIFLFGRFLGGLGGSGYGIVQAYISDISTNENRTHRLGLIGASFGLAFLIGPAIGGVLSSFGNHVVGYGGALCVLLNFLLVIFLLPEPSRHKAVETLHFEKGKWWHIPVEIQLLLAVSFFTTIGFAPIQSISGQYYRDRFGFDAVAISHVLIVVGITSIVYQGFVVRHIRKKFAEHVMVPIALVILMVGFLLQAINMNPTALWIFLPLFSIGMGSFQPSISSLVAKESGHEAGKYMGFATAAMGLGNIAGPALGGFLYGFGAGIPYYVSTAIFAGTILLALPIFRKGVKEGVTD